MTDPYNPQGHPPSGGFPTAGYQGAGYPGSGPMPAQTPGAGFPGPPSQGFPAPPSKSGGPLVPVLAVVMVVFLAAAGLMLFLWLGADDDAKAAGTRLQQTSTELADLTAQADEASKAADDAEGRVSGLEDENKDLQGEISSLRECADPVRDAIEAAAAKNDSALNKALKAMIDNC